MIVLHAISLPEGVFSNESIDQLFMGTLDPTTHVSFADLQGLQVSAHFLIARDGQTMQYVACAERAWHAGVSSWQGRENCNDYAIGIEIIGDQTHPFMNMQYRECARICHTLMQQYPAITNERIVGHQDVAPGRKWDPGKQWDWKHFRRSLARIRLPEQGIR